MSLRYGILVSLPGALGQPVHILWHKTILMFTKRQKYVHSHTGRGMGKGWRDVLSLCSAEGWMDHHSVMYSLRKQTGYPRCAEQSMRCCVYKVKGGSCYQGNALELGETDMGRNKSSKRWCCEGTWAQCGGAKKEMVLRRSSTENSDCQKI